MIYRLYVPIQGMFQMDEPAYEIEEDMDLLESPQEEYIPGEVSLSEGELAEYQNEIQLLFQKLNTVDNRWGCDLLRHNLGYYDLQRTVQKVEITAVIRDCVLQGKITVAVAGILSTWELGIIEEHVREQFENGWGSHIPEIIVPGGKLKISIPEPESCRFCIEKKYKITDIPHPQYPWLHRIRSLVMVNEHVPVGTLGGYVQRVGNLSQEGGCWIYDNAICCEDAVVEKDAGLFDGAMARASALVTGDSCLYDRAVAEGHCCIRSGEIKEDARIAGDAVINESVIDGLSPLIAGRCSVYGEVRGLFVIKDNVFPGEILVNPTEDFFILEHGKRDVLVKERKLEPPQKYVQQHSAEKPKVPSKKKKQPER